MTSSSDPAGEGVAWQRGIWDRYPDIYRRQVDRRFAAVVEQVKARVVLPPGHRVLDLGTGTGAVALRAAPLVVPGGEVVGVDISPAMLAVARERATRAGLAHVRFHEGRAEAIPAADATLDIVLASLSLMYVVDRAAAAREIARVLRPAGRLVAAVWGGADQCDIVLFQQTAGRFAPPPPVPGVGPGALADATPMLTHLAEAGIEAHVETEVLGFDFPDFASAWDALARVTTAQLPPARQQEAKAVVLAQLWPHGDGPRQFRNLTQFIVGQRRA